VLIFVLTRFLRANRHPVRLKTRWLLLAPGRARLVFGSIVNAAAEGKRLCAIDALR
jgi:hypothetical protein